MNKHEWQTKDLFAFPVAERRALREALSTNAQTGGPQKNVYRRIHADE
jgi:hypothetical protein